MHVDQREPVDPSSDAAATPAASTDLRTRRRVLAHRPGVAMHIEASSLSIQDPRPGDRRAVRKLDPRS